MKRLKPMTSGGNPPVALGRDRRKSYYPGKYDKEVFSVAVIAAMLLVFILTLPY